MSVPRPFVNDRVLLRDRPWVVRQVTEATGGVRLLRAEALDGEEPPWLEVALPPEEIQLLPPEDPCFDLSQLDSFVAWANSHRLLAATLIRHEDFLEGARFGRVTLEAYQLVPTLRILEKPRPSLLIADDVGLGKTIEAGLVMLELLARGRARRILVVVPPGLMEQWRQELYERFGLEFWLIGNASEFAAAQEALPAGLSAWDALPRVITSIDYLKKETVRHRALRTRWDLVIVDEAHALAESGTPRNPYSTQRTRLGRALRDAARGLLLLTATPHNGYAHAFRSLLELVEPTLATFHGSPEDLRRRIGTAMVRRLKSQICRRAGETEQAVFPQRTVEGVRVKLGPASRRLLFEVSAYCSKTATEAKNSDEAELVGFAMQIIKKRALSSWSALAKTLEHRLEALQDERGREEAPTASELRDLQADIPTTETQAERIARRIVRSAIPKEERRRQAEIRAIKRIRALLRAVADEEPKIEALRHEIELLIAADPSEKLIVFTEYRDTLDAIHERLQSDPHLRGRCVVLHGGLSRRERLKRQDAFARPEVRVLLATDAASEGLNLQHYCRRIVHMELPWNPNRLEQRNGRVDRYGQSREPIIKYLYYPDSPEDDVLALLVQKIERMTRDCVSAPDILGNELTLLDATAPDAQERKERLEQLFDDHIAEVARNVHPLLLAQQDVAMEADRVYAQLGSSEPLLADDLALEEAVLALLGTEAAKPVNGLEGVFRIRVPWNWRGDGVKPVYEAATFRRSIAARYRQQDVEYITPLHPLVQAMAKDARRRLLQFYASARGLPPRRLAARTVEPHELLSVLFTWLGRIQSAGRDLQEHLIPVRLDLEGRIVEPPAQAQRWLVPGPTGDVPKARLEELFRSRFEWLLERSRQEAETWLRGRVAALRDRRQQLAAVLRRDLQKDLDSRLAEIAEEEERARGVIEPSGQLKLFAEQQPRSFDSRRELVEEFRHRRLEEIAAFEQVDDPAPPQPLGALFLVPEGGTP
jgi:superfamily II DNA or RNA helicase